MIEVRLECLRIAAALCSGVSCPDQVAKDAARLEAYVTQSQSQPSGSPARPADTQHKYPDNAVG
jgi:hypothetical protein